MGENMGGGELRPYAETFAERSNLTRLQLLYWVSQKLRTGVPLFSATLVFTLPTAVDLPRFQTAVDAVVQGNDALRGVVVEVEGVPQWQVRQRLPQSLILLDLSGEPEPDFAAQAWIQSEAERPFILDEQLFRTALIQVAPDKFFWVLHQHHLITDAASNFLIFRQVAALAGAAGAGEPPIFPAFEAYRDYERSFRLTTQYQRAARFWQEKLVGEVEPLRFFGRLPRRRSTRVHRLEIDLGSERRKQLTTLFQQRKELFNITPYLSMYTLLASVTFALIYRLTAVRRLSFLSPVQNRVNLPFRETVGLLMQLVPFFIDVDPEDTFFSLAQKMRAETRGTMRHYQYGTGLSVQNKVHPVMFNYHQRPALVWAGQPVVQEMVDNGHGGDVLAVHLHEFEASASLHLMVDMHEEVFPVETRQQIGDAFVILLDAFLEDPDRVIENVILSLPQTAVPQSQPPPQAHLEPRDMLEFQLRQFWQGLLAAPEIGVSDDFFDLGGSSLQAMRLMSQIEALTGRVLPMSMLLEAPTIAQLAGLLRQETAVSWQKLVTVQPGSPSLRQPLYLIPGAGGNGLAIARIARHLHPDQPVYTFLLPEMSGPETAVLTVAQMAAHYRVALLAVQPDGPYQIGGYSAGGVAAFELAQQLRADGREVAFMAVIDAPAQGAGYGRLRWLTRVWARRFGVHKQAEQELFLHWRDRLFRIEYLLHRGWRERLSGWLGGTGAPAQPPAPDADEWGSRLEDKRLQAAFAAADRAVRCYIPRPYPGRVTLFRSERGYGRTDVRSPYPDLGWGKVATKTEIITIPGNHVQIVQEPQVAELGCRLQAQLDKTLVPE